MSTFDFGVPVWIEEKQNLHADAAAPKILGGSMDTFCHRTIFKAGIKVASDFYFIYLFSLELEM